METGRGLVACHTNRWWWRISDIVWVELVGFGQSWLENLPFTPSSNTPESPAGASCPDIILCGYARIHIYIYMYICIYNIVWLATSSTIYNFNKVYIYIHIINIYYRYHTLPYLHLEPLALVFIPTAVVHSPAAVPWYSTRRSCRSIGWKHKKLLIGGFLK